MKLCTTCGKAHPDDVTTSHHPNNCSCGSRVLHAPDGNNQGPMGCIWCRVFATPQNRSDVIAQFEQDLKRLNQGPETIQ